MTDLAQGTTFENSIELIGGQRFPDIIAKKYYGIEVKTTTQNHWRSTGNSVLESTRVESVERIYMLFAKLFSPVEFRCRPYEECLSEVVVTHSPRYLIDMNLRKGETIFDKIDTPYDILRKRDNPIKPIVNYYKNKLKPGDELWWMDHESVSATNFVIRIWNNLTTIEKESIKSRAMVYFPELFSNSNDKFLRLAVWLVTQEGVVCRNIRDPFTAGGKGQILIGRKTYKNIPRIFLNLFENLDTVLETISMTSSITLSEFWNIKTNERRKISDWLELVNGHSKTINDAKHLNIKEILSEMIST
jgi:hypothetical protein